MRFLRSCVVVALGLVPGFASAAAGDWLVRGRVIDVHPDASTNKTLSALNVDVDNTVVPELDFSYFITDNVSAELILATSKHDVTSDLGKLGSVKVLPPTLTLQYHFMPDSSFRPYLGVGLNYTRFYNVDLGAAGQDIHIDNSSFGWAVQAGADIAINKDWFVNVDVKKIRLGTDVKFADGTKLGTLDIDPYVFGIGFGTRF